MARTALLAMALATLSACTPTAPTRAVDDAAVTGPPDRVERLAAACNGCHGADGGGSGTIPALAGRDAAMLAGRLAVWRQSDATDAADHVMVRFAHVLDAADAEALADHYAGLPARIQPQQ